MTKRLGAVLAALLVVGLVGACGAASTPAPATPAPATSAAPETAIPATTAPESAAPASPAPEQTPTPTVAEPVTLVLWDWASPLRDELIKMFEAKYPNIKLQTSDYPADYVERQRAAVAAKKGPDIMTLFGGSWVAGLQQGLLPLQDRLTEDMKTNLQHIPAMFSPDGNLYAVPNTSYAYVMMYNKPLFEKAGLDPTAPPKTWDELLSACDKLKAAGIAPIGSGWKDGYGLDAWFWTGGTQSLDADQRAQWERASLPLTTSELANGLTAMLEMNKRGCFQEGADARTYYYEVKEQFDAGKSAMIIWPAGVGTTIEESEKALGTGNVGVFMPPALPGAKYQSAMDSGPNSGLAITTWSEHPEEAWKYIEFLSSKEAQDFVWSFDKHFPNYIGADTPATEQVYKDMLALLQNRENYPLFLNMPEPAMAAVRENAIPMLKGEITPQAILERAAPVYEQYTAPLRGN